MMTDIDRIREALQFIDASDRETWLRMGMAIKSELADTGFDLWEAWSLQAESFNTKDARDVWKSIRAGGKVTIGTLFYEAKANGWRDDGMHQKPTSEELAERRRIAAERAAQEEAEIARERADTASRAAAILKAATEAKADHPYLSRKRVSPVATLREIDAGAAAAILGYPPKSGGDLLTGRLLVVPVKQGEGISTLELIDGDKRKAALAGRGSKVGGYWATERLPDGDGAGLTLLIGEGVATVLSASEATGQPAIAALSSGNLPAVAKAMRERYPAAALVILADLVKATGEPDPHAIEAAKVGAGKTAIPDFGSDRVPDMTDFNDMAVICGLEAVRRTVMASIEATAAPADETSPEPNDAPPYPGAKDRPCFVVLDQWMEWGGRKRRPGTYFCNIVGGKGEDDLPVLSNEWFCSPLYVEAITEDGQGDNFGRLLRFRNSLGRWREWPMPMELLRGAGDELRGALLAMGVELDPEKGRKLLPTYLQWRTPKRRILCAIQTGWHGKSFVLPDAVIGPDAASIAFQSGERSHAAFSRGGTLAGWQEGIAAKAVGNPLLMLALSASFAGPLLARCHAESGGVHLVGDSSSGKTTALEAAAATWGGPGYRRSWRATANGLEGAAAHFNDGLLVIDEISECDPRQVGEIVYLLGNGRGKQRAARTGMARPITRWRCVILSSGERTVATTMTEGGHRTKAGQSVRLLDIQAMRKYGAWDDLHDAPSGAAFADAIKVAAGTHYGHAGRAFLERLARDERDFCAMLEAAKTLPMLSAADGEGQDKRAAARLALIGMAGELATQYGITGWPEGEAMRAAAEAFRLWRAGRGRGNDERRQITERMADFLDRHGDGRFSDAAAISEGPPIRDRAGWWRDTADGREYLMTAGAMREALRGFDFRRALDALEELGALPPANANGERARFYRFGPRPAKLYPVNYGKLMEAAHGA